VLAATEITDRAKRYRAHSPELEPGPPKQCGFCGSKRNVVPHHISGNEADLIPENLMWACKACNTRLGFLYRDNGIGKRTVQYNPSKGTKREQMERYAAAIKVMRGQFEGDIGHAVSVIRSTPREIRSSYTSRTWPVRRQMYGDSGRANPIRVPAETKALVGAALYAPAAGIQLGRSLMGRKNGRRRNPEAQSASVYEAFHGRPAERDTVIRTELFEHKNLAAIGDLCWIVVRYETPEGEMQDVRLEDFNGAFLAMNEKRPKTPQLFIEGGDQRVSLKQFEIGPPIHETETLGRMVCVAYFTTKDHLGDEGGEAEYVHVIEMPLDMAEFKEWGLHEMAKAAGLSNAAYWDELAEETEGAQGPDVIYDTRNRLMLLSGGSYSIPDEGIAN
jgi:hypothetical protein